MANNKLNNKPPTYNLVTYVNVGWALAQQCNTCATLLGQGPTYSASSHKRFEITQVARFFFALLLLMLTSTLCTAMPDDREKTLELSANSADLNQQTHRGEYIGNVQLDQGSSHLRAANAVTEGDKQNKLMLAIANGDQKEQAHFWTLTALDKPPLHAYADTIRYHPDRHLIELIGNARVVQGDNSFSAPTISYDTLEQHVISKSDGKARTVIIIHPGKTKP